MVQRLRVSKAMTSFGDILRKISGRSVNFISNFQKQSRKYIKDNWSHLTIQILSVVNVILIWYILIEAARNGNQFLMEHRLHQLPTPIETWEAFLDSLTPTTGVISKPSILQHAGASVWRVLLGFCLAVMVGVPSGLIMGRSKYAADLGGPIVELIRPIPPLAWIGVGLLVFTFNVGLFIVFIGVVFPVILSTINGVKAVDEELIEAAKTLGANNIHIFGKVVIPGALPSIVTGMRIGLGIGWMSIVAAEMVGMREGLGLGYYVWIMYDSYSDYAHMVAGMLLIGLIGWLMNVVIQRSEKYIIRWQE